MDRAAWSLPLWMALERMTDEELIPMLKYIKLDHEQPNLLQMRRYLREKRAEHERTDQHV